MNAEWLSMDEAAAVASVTRRTISQWWRDGTIAAEDVRYTPSGRTSFRASAVGLQTSRREGVGVQGEGKPVCRHGNRATAYSETGEVAVVTCQDCGASLYERE